MAAAGGDLPRHVTIASAAPAAPAIDNAAYLSSFPDSRGATPVAAASQPEPIFRSLFQAGERTQPISPAVQGLGGQGASAAPEVRAPGRLDLFSDRSGTFSS